uniref:Transposase (putative) gypsy type domain-containing protein n=1 Tax=Tanacetum cinerariifolium TaxID=118510 RepID=A0A6L2JWG8_TANCI|nr:hypothetical protein [Tanacetum cinerariifolium]
MLPISSFICKVLNYFKVHISRFNPFGMMKLTTFSVMCRAYGGEPTVNLLHSFLNLGRASDWLTLLNRGSADVPIALVKPITHLADWKEIDFRSFMMQKIDGEFKFLSEGCTDDNQCSPSSKSVNNKAPVIDAKSLTSVHPSDIVEDVIDFDPLYPRQAQELISALYKATASCDAIRAREIEKDKAYAELERKCNESLLDLDKNLLVADMRTEIETLQGQMDVLKQNRASVVAKVVPDAAIKLIRSDEMDMLVAKLVKVSIIYVRCAALEEVDKLKEPFVIEKMAGYRPFSKQECDQAGNDLANASYPFLSKYVNDPHASLEQLLSKKPESLCSKPSYVIFWTNDFSLFLLAGWHVLVIF